MSHITPADFESSWLAFRRSATGSAIWRASEWVVGCEIEWSKNEPAQLFEAILLVSENDLTTGECKLLGSGPIEALLANNFRNFATPIFEMAKSNEKLRIALHGTVPPEENEAEFDLLIAELEKNNVTSCHSPPQQQRAGPKARPRHSSTQHHLVMITRAYSLGTRNPPLAERLNRAAQAARSASSAGAFSPSAMNALCKGP